MPKFTACIFSTDRVISTIGKHIVSGQSLPCGGVIIRIDESSQFGIVISALEVIESGLVVIDISTVAQGVGFAEGGCHGTGGCQDVAPRVVGVLDDRCAAGIQDGGNVTLDVGDIVVVRTIVGNRHGCAGCVISKVQRVTAHGHSAQAAAVVNVAVGSGTVGTLCPQTIGIIGHAPCGGTVGHGGQFSAVFPGVSPSAIREHIDDLVGGDSLFVITGQQITPCEIAVGELITYIIVSIGADGCDNRFMSIFILAE